VAWVRGDGGGGIGVGDTRGLEAKVIAPPYIAEIDDSYVVKCGRGLDLSVFEIGRVVYFLESNGAVKIGWTEHLEGRMRDLQSCNPVRLRLLAVAKGGLRLERVLHRALASSRIRGEWFRWSPELSGLIVGFRMWPHMVWGDSEVEMERLVLRQIGYYRDTSVATTGGESEEVHGG
jgi:hypothetical protein